MFSNCTAIKKLKLQNSFQCQDSITLSNAYCDMKSHIFYFPKFLSKLKSKSQYGICISKNYFLLNINSLTYLHLVFTAISSYTTIRTNFSSKIPPMDYLHPGVLVHLQIKSQLFKE